MTFLKNLPIIITLLTVTLLTVQPSESAVPTTLDWGSLSPTGQTTFGVYDADDVTVLQTGDLAQLIWAGADGTIDPPQLDGTPGGDDELLDTSTVQNGPPLPPPLQNKGYISIKTYSFDTDDPQNGGLIYIRAWNDSNPATALHYGDSITSTLTGGETFNAPRWSTNMPTSTNTPTPSATGINTNTPTATRTSTPMPTETHTPNPSSTATKTVSVTNTPTPNPSSTSTMTHTPGPSATASNTPTATSTHTLGPSPTASNTPTTTSTHTLGPSPTATNTSIATSSHTATASPTRTNTQTPTSTQTQGASPTVTYTLTASPSPTAVSTPVSGDNAYEPNDTCVQANDILTNGTTQAHAFEKKADEDWGVFHATAGTSYLIEAYTPPGSSADLMLDLYDSCESTLLATQHYTFTPNVRLEIEALTDGPHYLRLLNDNVEETGSTVTYQLSVRALRDEALPGVLVLLAGRLEVNDPLEENIYQVTDTAYTVFQQQGYDDDRIYYLAPDLSHPNVNALASVENLEFAITEWALERLAPEQSLTLYLTDHGGYDTLYLDQPEGESVTPEQLNQWLSELESKRPGVHVNVIVEASYSGSFIDPTQTISADGRVVIASTGAQRLAWASEDGAIFSDYFLTALEQGQSLYQSFQNARWAVELAHPAQTPWLEDEGNGSANDPSEGQEAARRGFAFAGTPGSKDNLWPPYIVEASIPTAISDGTGQIWAEVRDQQGIQRVWAEIYPPSYQAPSESEELVQEQAMVSMLTLDDQGNNRYMTTFTDFDETGTYYIVIHAKDDYPLKARPLAFEVQIGWQLYLPMIQQ